ncbi:MAG: cytochrome b6 [Neisseria sp.]|nr:cytochrome b6 [Neisseria sp.]
MAANDKIRAATRNAFVCIALMMLAFLVFVLVMLVPFGLSGAHQVQVVRAALYVLLAFAVLGGGFSLRVAWLRKRAGR